MAGVHRQSPRKVFIHSFGFPSHVSTNLGPAAQQSQIRDKVDHSQQHKTNITTTKGKEEDITHMVRNANAIPIPWIRPAWPCVARHFTCLATAEAQGAGTSHDSKEWTSPPRGTGLRSPSLAHSRAHAASRQTNEERRPLKRETRQWIALDKHHQAAGPELGLRHVRAIAVRQGLHHSWLGGTDVLWHKSAQHIPQYISCHYKI